MNIQHYKQRLLDLENTLFARIGQEADQGRGDSIDSACDVEAVPWTPYCLKHAQRLEIAASLRPPTL